MQEVMSPEDANHLIQGEKLLLNYRQTNPIQKEDYSSMKS
jgi:hypothetical protein